MLCPVCNGLESLFALCRSCGQPAADCGRLSDYSGPYSPYEPDPDLHNTDAAATSVFSAELTCKHLVSCPVCGMSEETAVKQWRASEH
ncbi:hypothetical protein BCM02_110268 [Paenibacillus methanolicus]|uniref:Uncharacterized protein n=1 Tax=Paenibacillus methanolicus TaxID=582686 RepID=A0A5S5BYE2_9BACL|nr:hypothetical protein BCM02_110268 [Paenibacillus methanolicus]